MMSGNCKYSMVRVDVCNNTIYLEDTNDASLIAIHPDSWEFIKEIVDQWIEDGHLEDTDD